MGKVFIQYRNAAALERLPTDLGRDARFGLDADPGPQKVAFAENLDMGLPDRGGSRPDEAVEYQQAKDGRIAHRPGVHPRPARKLGDASYGPSPRGGARGRRDQRGQVRVHVEQ